MPIISILSSVAGPIAQYLWGPLQRHTAYLIFYNKKIQKLESKFVELDNIRKDVLHEVDAASLERLEEATNVVRTWLVDVENVEKSKKEIMDEAQKRNKRYLACFPNFSLRYQLGRKAAKNVEAIEELLKKGDFNGVSQTRLPPSTGSLIVVNKDLVILQSTQSTVDQILNAMQNEEKDIIGVLGMGGVGKTTVMREVRKLVTSKRLFNVVVMVTVSQYPNMKRIQADIASQLGLRITEDSDEVMAQAIAERLEKEKKFLVILDDLWERIDINELRIPIVGKHKGCKVAITTRRRSVCSDMECEEIIEVKPLSDEEAWNLFKINAGLEKEPPNVARDVARECGGLPLALVTLGKAMRAKSIDEWQTTLNRLQKSVPEHLPSGVLKGVFQSIRLSYDYLDSDEAKSCFLHCCLFPEDHDINETELMRVLKGAGLIRRVDNLDEAQNVVKSLVLQLKSFSMLAESEREGHVKMHDIARDVASWIAASAKDDKFYVRAGLRLTRWPEEEELEECHRISLMSNDITKLPHQVECSKLQTLMLNSNENLTRIPSEFFRHMIMLRVLDLSYTSVKKLPASVSCLVNLRSLNLEGCRDLEDVSPINRLKMLEILNLGGTSMHVIPGEVAELINLRCLDLATTVCIIGKNSVRFKFGQEKRVPPNLLSRLLNLEQLFMLDGFQKWRPTSKASSLVKKKKASEDDSCADFAELARLTQLTHLYVRVENPEYMSEDLGSHPWDGLTNFCVCFVVHDLDHEHVNLQRSGREMHLTSTKSLAGWVHVLLQKTTRLELYNCEEAKVLVSKENGIPPSVFCNLEHLKVKSVANMTKLADEEQLPKGVFAQLRRLVLADCNGLANLLPSKLWRRMQLLEILVVKSCSKKQRLFDDDDDAITDEAQTVKVMLPRLEKLLLGELPQLESIYEGNARHKWFPNLKQMIVASCGLRCIVSQPMASGPAFQQLETLYVMHCGQMEKIIALNRARLSTKTFENLRVLIICLCPRLTSLFSSRQACHLRQLDALEVIDCATLKAIVTSDEEEETAKNRASKGTSSDDYVCIFPKLRTLQLTCLPELTAFHDGSMSSLEWPHLECLHVELCPKLGKLPLGQQTSESLTRMDGCMPTDAGVNTSGGEFKRFFTPFGSIEELMFL